MVLHQKWHLPKATIDTKLSKKSLKKTFGIDIENNDQKPSDSGPNFLQLWSPNRTKIHPKIDPKTDTKFACILTPIFDRFWPVLGAKLGAKSRSFFGFLAPFFCARRPWEPKWVPGPLPTAPRNSPSLDFHGFWVDFGRFFDDFLYHVGSSQHCFTARWREGRRPLDYLG